MRAENTATREADRHAVPEHRHTRSGDRSDKREHRHTKSGDRHETRQSPRVDPARHLPEQDRTKKAAAGLFPGPDAAIIDKRQFCLQKVPFGLEVVVHEPSGVMTG
ncbi:hypothetical protein [Alkalicoccus urumqiensis]|uniref:Uncharacterized protein n=1 Tax=Alkalicoccus urumqiensis TaxID=1548213 RepID=A0A2P6MIB8_ALKUR|nr:hypothetical protein [Alkalicoccus urumqiensis]PRO66031.1 hypothetical protein C6I21_06940 [Alkalicoccus urumqiensis]